MPNVRTMTAAALAFALLVAAPSTRAGESAGDGAAMTLRDVEALSEAGVADDVITSQIRATGQVFHLSTEEILRLHTRGVSGEVIAALVATGVRDDHVEDLRDARDAAERELDALNRAASRDRVVVYGAYRYPYRYRYWHRWPRHRHVGFGYSNPWHHYYSSSYCW